MNLLAAGSQHILHRGDRLGQMKITIRDTGNVIDEEALINLSTAIDIEVLRDYRLAVGRSTREISSNFSLSS